MDFDNYSRDEQWEENSFDLGSDSYEPQQEGNYDNGNNGGNGKGSRVSAKTLLIGLSLVVIVVIIIVALVGGINVTKNTEEMDSPKSKTESVVAEDNKSNSVENKSGEVSKKGEQSANSDKYDDSKVPENIDKTVGNNRFENGIENNQSENSASSNTNGVMLNKIDGDLALGNSGDITVVVSGKDAYIVDNLYYTYSITLMVPNGDSATMVKYFCSKGTYDTVNKGDSVKMKYQLDENGCLSISSLSK